MSAGKKVYAVFSWAAAAACMGVIFYMSAQPGDDSAAMSGAVMEFVTRVFNIEPSTLVIRKTAHALEFAGLALLLNNAVYATFKSRFNAPAAFAAAALYAVSDEIHQLFVAGRACSITDMLIDSAGAAAGTAAALVIYAVIKKISERRNKLGSTKSL